MRNAVAIGLLGLFLPFLASAQSAELDLGACSGAPSPDIQYGDLAGCYSQCLGAHLGLRRPTDATDENSTTCYNVRQQMEVVRPYQAVVAEIESLNEQIDSITGWDSEARAVTAGKLQGQIDDSAEVFFSNQNKKWTDYMNLWMGAYCDKVGVSCIGETKNAFVQGDDYLALFPTQSQTSTVNKVKASTTYTEEIIRYRQDLFETGGALRNTCSNIGTIDAQAAALRDGQIDAIGNKLANEAATGFASVSVEDFLQLQHAVHATASRAEFLKRSTLGNCNSATIPCINSGGVLPGEPTCGAGVTSDSGRGMRYLVDRLLPGIANGFLSFTIAMAVIAVTIGGIMYIASAFNPELRDRAKRTITYSVIGMIIAMLAYFIVRFRYQHPHMRYYINLCAFLLPLLTWASTDLGTTIPEIPKHFSVLDYSVDVNAFVQNNRDNLEEMSAFVRGINNKRSAYINAANGDDRTRAYDEMLQLWNTGANEYLGQQKQLLEKWNLFQYKCLDISACEAALINAGSEYSETLQTLQKNRGIVLGTMYQYEEIEARVNLTTEEYTATGKSASAPAGDWCTFFPLFGGCDGGADDKQINGVWTDNTSEAGYISLIPRLIRFLGRFAGSLIFLAIIWVGITMIVQGDNDEAMGNAKQYFLYLVIGALVVSLAYSIIQIVYNFVLQ